MLAAVHHGSATMPVTARLSQKFYERLGDDIAKELEDWFNAVDATYRNDLGQLNELNFQRFDAKVGERLAELREELRSELRDEIARVRDAMTEMRVGLLDRVAGVERRVSDTRAELVRWMFGFWIATLVPLGGLMVGLFTVFR
jgi:hypothetical protein